MVRNDQRSIIYLTIAAASALIMLSGVGCVGHVDEAPDETEPIATAEEALSALPAAPIIYYPSLNGDQGGHNIVVQWSKVSDATQYRLQITELNYFSGDTCTAPCDVEAVLSASSYCGTTACTAYVYIPGSGARSLRVRGGKPGVGGAWSAVRKFGVSYP
jgi:hypothetical protein